MNDYIKIQAEKNRLLQETSVLVTKIYEISNVGGLLHIVLDDGNLKDKHIKYCIEEINLSDDKDKELYLQCAMNLLKMTPTQRKKLYQKWL